LISVWRIGYCPKPQPSDKAILSFLGYGSTLGNGRWHTKGQLQIVYAGASRALCQLEKRVHCNGANPANQVLMRLDIPEAAPLFDIKSLGLLDNWRSSEAITQSLGLDWLASGASLGLWVPSYLEPEDKILLINPAHHLYSAIELSVERNPFTFDPRLFAI
jgi:RES domain-containing protein